MSCFESRSDGLNFIDRLLVDGCDERFFLEFDECLVALFVEEDRFGEAVLDVGRHLVVFGHDLVVLYVLLQDARELAQVFQLFEVLVDGVELLDFLALDGEGGIDLEGERGDLVHGLFEDPELVVDQADVVLHFADRVDAADELAVVLEDQRLDLVVVDLDLLIDLVVAPHQLLYRVLLQHPQHVPLGVEVGRIDVHRKNTQSKF